ncbi:MAG: Tfp pilus assembly protein PilF [Parcubacteria bacterium C7867-006]|nr:MAG: Tfp pilus assembly protein PilF [Parcubacteria bacterium C7867-006]
MEGNHMNPVSAPVNVTNESRVEASSVSSKKSIFDKISFGILLAVTALAPLFFVPVSFISTQFGTSLLFAFGVIISILIYLVSGLSNGSLEFPKPSKYIIGFSAVVPLVYVLAGVSNGFSRMSFFGYTFDINTVGFIVLAFVYMFLVSLIFKTKERVFNAYFAFVVSSLVFSIWLLVRIFFGAKVLAFGLFTDVTSTVLGTWNNVGIFFGICAILSLVTFQMLNANKIVKIVVSIALALSLLFLALVNFSIIWIILGVCSFLFILYSVFNIESSEGESVSFVARLSRIPLYPLIVLAISVIFVLWGTTVGAYLANKLSVTNIEVRPSLSVTMDIARNTIKERPLFGSGPNTFVNQWLVYKPSDIITTVFWNTDFNNGIGLIPTFAVTTGLIGVLSWLLFLGFFVYFGVKSIFSRFSDSFVKYILTSSFFVSLYLWIMTFVYVPSTVIFILTFFFTGLFFASVYIAGLVPVTDRKFSANPRTGFISSFFIVVFIVSGAALGYGLFQNSKSLWYFQKSSYALNTSKDSKISEEYMLKAIKTVPMDIYYRALSEIEIYKLNEVLSQDTKKVKPEDVQKQFSDVLTSAIKAGIGAKDADSSNYMNWVSLGRVYEAVSVPQLNVQGAYESASLAYQEALRRNPKNPGIFMLFARLAVNHNDLKAAESYALQAIQAKNNYLDAYFLLSQIEVATQNIQGAISSVTAASVIDPTNPAIFFQLGLLKYNAGDFTGAIQALEKSTTMTPDYANAKYFLGLSYEMTKQHDKAIAQFQDLAKTNPDSQEVKTILENLLAGKPIFTNAEEEKPEKAKTLPVKEKQQ